MLIDCGSQSLGNVGDQYEADVIGPFNNLKGSVWGERRGLESGVGAHVLEEGSMSLLACGCHVVDGWCKVFWVWDLDRWGSVRAGG